MCEIIIETSNYHISKTRKELHKYLAIRIEKIFAECSIMWTNIKFDIFNNYCALLIDMCM